MNGQPTPGKEHPQLLRRFGLLHEFLRAERRIRIRGRANRIHHILVQRRTAQGPERGLALGSKPAGVYGVVAYTTALRTREIGIRLAMGATPRDVMGVVLRGAMTPLLAGLAVSFAAALMVSRLLASILYEISGTDPVAYVSAAALLLAIGAMASARPAWKAATVDPMQTLRAE